MCGICGIILKDGKKVSLNILKSMADRMVHRGPDDSGYFLQDNMGFGFRRLSIIDLDNGGQPMINNNNTIAIIFNGEIYNYNSLRENLLKKGYSFTTKSDTEVILHAYANYGLKMVDKLRGMFSIVIWDKKKKEIILIRDRIGKKPLFYAHYPNGFVFASEMKSLLKYSQINKKISLSSLDQFICWGYVPGENTILKSIKRLLPGHILRYSLSKNKYKILKYWRPQPSVINKSHVDLDNTIREAVRIRMTSDVPLGAFLSGGIDSSIIVALMAEYSEKPIKTFSVGFENQKYNELPLAQIVAKRYNTDHHEYILKPNVQDVLPEIVWYADEPFGDSSSLPTYYLTKMASKKVTVALNGDGGDESFGGYHRYQAVLKTLLYKKIPKSVRSYITDPLIELLPPGEYSNRLKNMVRYSNLSLIRHYNEKMIIYNKVDRLRLYNKDIKNKIISDFQTFNSFSTENKNFRNSPLNEIIINDFLNYLPGDLLVKMDRMAMANSLEARSPFLDHKVIEAGLSLPDNERMLWYGPNKRFLRKTYSSLIPNQILKRSKTGFGFPISEWLRGSLVSMSNDVLLGSKSLNRNIFNMAAIKKILKRHEGGTKDLSYLIWSLIMLELWFEKFIDNN